MNFSVDVSAMNIYTREIVDHTFTIVAKNSVEAECAAMEKFWKLVDMHDFSYLYSDVYETGARKTPSK